VSDVGWIRESTRLVGLVMPCPVRVFGNGQLAEAVEWLRSLPERPAVSHRLLVETGVLLVEVRQALRAPDFDALASDSKVADLAPRLAEHFVQAEVRRFGYDALDAAVAWAGDASPRDPSAS